MAPIKKVKPAKSEKNPLEADEEQEQPVVSGQLAKKVKKQQLWQAKQRGVVFIKHLPHGFFEKQLQGFFEQFGRVTRLRLARSKRTGGSKGFAFIEFQYPEIAQVAAETMNNYLMFNKVVKAVYIPPEQQKFNYFKTSVKKIKLKYGKEVYISSHTRKINNIVAHHNNWSEENYQKRTLANINKLKKLTKKYAHLGIDFSEIAMYPKEIETSEAAHIEPEQTPNASKSKEKLLGKRKTVDTPTSKPVEKKVNKSLELADLLGNTINDDSDDEDYVATEESSDEETYGFTNDDDDEEEEAVLEEEEEEDEELDLDEDRDVPNEESEEDIEKHTKSVKPSKAKSNLVMLPRKAPKGDRFAQLVKRKPLTGGIKKPNKKTSLQKPPLVKTKNLLKLEEAKKIAKPLQQINKKPKSTRKQKA